VPTYAQLNQRNPGVNAQRMRELRALYEGDEKLEALYPVLLPKRPREREERYQLRLKEAEYRNYLGPIIDYFKSMLFVSRPVLKAKVPGAKDATSDPGDFWTGLREDADRGGTDIDAMFGAVLVDAMVERTGWIRLHQRYSDGGPPPTDRADFEKRGLNDVWLERLESCSVLDWELDETGRLAWAITHRLSRRRNSIESTRDTTVERWDYLTPESVQRFAISYEKGKEPKPDDPIAAIGDAEPHRFGAVPLVCLDLPPSLWVSARLRSPQLAHFRKLSALSWSLSATAYAMPVAKVGNPEEFQKQVMGAGYEIVIHKDDHWDWEAPPTGHFEALDREVKAEKDEIFRIAHQMALGVENNAAAVGRSAESKASDHESTRVVLTAFSRRTKEAMEYTMDLIARARGEDLEWSVEGLDDFAAFDLTAFLEQLTLTGEAGGIPSRTFNILAKQRIAEAMLRDVDEDVKATIREEIKEGTPEPGDELANDVAKMHALAAGLVSGNGANPSGNRGGSRGKPPAASGNGSGGAAAAPKSA
jgi:hypothetical protein